MRIRQASLPAPRCAAGWRRRSQGFSLLELMVTVAVFAVITGGLLVVFDSSSRLARSQTQVSVLHQSHRVAQAEIVRYVRSAGRGGLPITRLKLPDDGGATPPGPNGVPDWMEPVNAASYDNDGVFPEDGYAISVLNNVQGMESILGVKDSNQPDCVYSAGNCVLPGSDVLIVRGVFSTPLYYFGIDESESTDPIAASGELTLVVPGKVQVKGEIDWDLRQDLEPLEEVLKAAEDRAGLGTGGEAFILRDLFNPNAYFIMEFDHTKVSAADIKREKCKDVDPSIDPKKVPLCLSLPLKLDDTGSDPNDPYAKLAAGSILHGSAGTSRGDVRLPDTIGSIGVLEEYRFFVRLKWQPRPDSLPDRLVPVLSRARFLPGNVQVGSIVDIAENVIDLQIAVGVETEDFDTGGDAYGQILGDGLDADDRSALVSLPGPLDEILFNHPDDDPGTGVYAPPPNHAAWFDPELEFFFLRINTLVESAVAERNYRAPELLLIEDYDRGAPFSIPGSDEPTVSYNSEERRLYRRRWLQTVVDLRNLT